MPKGDDVKKLMASYGRPNEFRAAGERIIADAEKRGHMPLASSMRKILASSVPSQPVSSPASLSRLGETAEPAGGLLEHIEAERGLSRIVLAPETRTLIDGIIEEHRRAEELRRHNLNLRAKLLFCGPPGCGKTLAAEVLARELGLPLLVARLDVIISSYLGETASNLRRMFEFAGQRPAVLFLDEFDALARTRDDALEHSELRRVVGSLLMLIDRYQGRGLLIAATNLPGALDSALWRRFDEVMAFDPPGEREISALLALEFQNFPVRFKPDEHISRLGGLSFAEIERVCRDSIKAAVLARRMTVSETEFMASLKQEQRRKKLSRPGKTAS